MVTTEAAAKNAPVVPSETVPLPPQMPPPPPAHGGGDYSPYVWKQLGDIQQALGRLESAISQVQRSQDKADEKVDRLEEKLSGVTHKIYAATAILTILLVVGGFIVNKAWDLMASSIAQQATPKQTANTTGKKVKNP